MPSLQTEPRRRLQPPPVPWPLPSFPPACPGQKVAHSRRHPGPRGLAQSWCSGTAPREKGQAPLAQGTPRPLGEGVDSRTRGAAARRRKWARVGSICRTLPSPAAARLTPPQAATGLLGPAQDSRRGTPAGGLWQAPRTPRGQLAEPQAPSSSQPRVCCQNSRVPFQGEEGLRASRYHPGHENKRPPARGLRDGATTCGSVSGLGWKQTQPVGPTGWEVWGAAAGRD